MAPCTKSSYLPSTKTNLLVTTFVLESDLIFVLYKRCVNGGIFGRFETLRVLAMVM